MEYVTNERGERTRVLLEIAEYERMREALEELEDIRESEDKPTHKVCNSWLEQRCRGFPVRIGCYMASVYGNRTCWRSSGRRGLRGA